MTSVFLVLGDNGLGNSGAAVFGMYPTKALAEARIKDVNERGDGCDCLYVFEVKDVGPEGKDFVAWVGP